MLQYSMVYNRLFPLVAQTHTIIAGGKRMDRLLKQLNKDLVNNNVHLLPETHALSCCLESTYTKIAADGIEVARRSLGGNNIALTHYLNACLSNIFNLHRTWLLCIFRTVCALWTFYIYKHGWGR